MKHFLLVAMFFLMCFCVEPAQSAGMNSLYLVDNIRIDKTDVSVTKAKKAALSSAQESAFRILLKRLLTTEAYNKLSIDTKKLSSFVDSLRIKNEKKSRTRYIANVSIKFNKLRVKRYLRKKNIRFTETISPPSLVIPVFHSKKTYLWSPYNKWLQSWKDIKKKAILVPVVVPTGTEADRKLLTKKDILNKNIFHIKKLMKRYKTKSAFLAIAEQNDDSTNVRVIRIDAGTKRFNELKKMMISFSLERQGSAKEDLKLVSTQALFQLEEMWKQASATNFNEKQTLTLSFPVKKIDDLLKIKKKLEAISFVEKAQVKAIQKRQATLELVYTGTLNQLKSELSRNNLGLSYR